MNHFNSQLSRVQVSRLRAIGMRVRCIFFTFCALPYFLSCATSGSGPAGSPEGNAKLSVITSPGFNAIQPQNIVFLPLAGTRAKKLAAEEAERVSRDLYQAFASETDLEVLNLSRPDFLREQLAKIAPGPEGVRAEALFNALRDKAIQSEGSSAEVLGAPLVGLWSLSHFDSAAAGTSTQGRPSETGFRLQIFNFEDADSSRRRVADAEPPSWAAHYHSREESLAENVFRIREAVSRGLRFESAEALLSRGFRQAAKRFAEDSR